MATYEELIAAARTAQAEGRASSAQALAARAYEARTGSPFDGGASRSQETEEESDRTVASDIARGAGAGVVSLIQGLGELGALGVDAAADTDYSEAVTDFFVGAKDTLGLTPETTAGRAAESITNFGAAFIPIAGWLGRAGQAARGAQALGRAGRFGRSAQAFGRTGTGRALTGTRARLAGTTTLAAGVSDFFVSPEGMGTMSDAFDALPDVLETEGPSGLTGRDEAFRRLRNKIRVGAEGAAFGAAFETVFPVARYGSGLIAQVPGVPQAARLATNGMARLGDAVTSAFPRSRRMLTSAGETPRGLFEDLESTEAFIEGTTRAAENSLVAFDRAAQEFAPSMFSKLMGRGRAGVDRAYDDFFRYLQGEDDALAEYGPDVARAADRMREQIGNLSTTIATQVRDSGLDNTLKKQILDTFQANTNGYIRRLYKRFEDPNWIVPPEVVRSPVYKRAVDEVQGILQNMDTQRVASGALAAPRALGPLRDDATREVNRMIGLDTLNSGMDPQEIARTLVENAQKGKRELQRGDAPLYSLSDGLLRERSKLMENAPSLRELMGEMKDPRQAYLRTVGDMAQFVASSRLYDRTAREMAVDGATARARTDAGGRPLVIQGDDAEVVGKSLGYMELPSGTPDSLFGGSYGALSGAYVAPEIYNALTLPQRMTQGVLNEVLAVTLQAKGASQSAVTVYNPISQVRNFLSNIFVTMANGNTMRDLPFGDSFRLTAAKAADLDDPEFRRLYDIAANLGLREQQLQVNEFRELMREGSSLRTAGRVSAGAQALKDRIPFANALEATYSGTDTYWKITNWLAERAKYTNAFRRAGLAPDALDGIAEDLVRSGLGTRTSELTGTASYLDTLAGDIVKNTTPTYSRVPELVRNIRRIPLFGNFVAFPSEIIRNTANILDRSLLEMGFRASDELTQKMGPQNARILERQIRAIGAQRLSGYITAAAVIPYATAATARTALGWDESQVDALNMLAPYYMEGHQLVPLTRADDPNVEYIDLSYMMPYDFVLTPARAAMQAYQERGVVGGAEIEQIRDAAISSFGKLFEPFASESLIGERVTNVTLRRGTTPTGLQIYSENTPLGERLSRGLTHVLGGFEPGVAQMFVQERGGEFVPGRVTRAALGIPSASGQPYDTAEELGAIVSGLRPMQLRLPETFRYSGFEYNQAQREASNVFGREANANDSTAESVVEAYVRANDQLMSGQARLFALVEAARALGMTDQQIRRELRDEANLGREVIAQVMRGRFRPLELSDDRIRSVRRESRREERVLDRLPVREIRRLTQQYRRMDLPTLGAPEESALAAPPPQGLVPVQEDGAEAASVAGPVPAAPGPPPAAQPAGAAPPSLELLGSNPFEALQNLEIARRLSGQ